ncbi:MAG: sigma-70 family RNA polymerase sigma factor [Myxococcota bacterium]
MTPSLAAAVKLDGFGLETVADVSSCPSMTDEQADTLALVRDALDGNDEAMETLVRRIDPIVRGRVGRVLLKRRAESRGRNLRAEAEDFAQEVFVALFARRGRALREWNPERGLSFDRFVGFLAEREVHAVLRTQRRSPWSEDPTEGETLERLGGTSSNEEDRAAARQLLQGVARVLRQRLTPLGFQYFQRLFVEQCPVPKLAEETGASKMSIYAWRSRLKRELERARREVEEAAR